LRGVGAGADSGDVPEELVLDPSRRPRSLAEEAVGEALAELPGRFDVTLYHGVESASGRRRYGDIDHLLLSADGGFAVVVESRYRVTPEDRGRLEIRLRRRARFVEHLTGGRALPVLCNAAPAIQRYEAIAWGWGLTERDVLLVDADRVADALAVILADVPAFLAGRMDLPRNTGVVSDTFQR
jgi:hypothetical protein